MVIFLGGLCRKCGTDRPPSDYYKGRRVCRHCVLDGLLQRRLDAGHAIRGPYSGRESPLKAVVAPEEPKPRRVGPWEQSLTRPCSWCGVARGKDAFPPHSRCCYGCLAAKAWLARQPAVEKSAKESRLAKMERLNRLAHDARQRAYNAIICPKHFRFRIEREEGGRVRLRCPDCLGEKRRAYLKTATGRAIHRRAKKARRHNERNAGKLPWDALDSVLSICGNACLSCGATAALTIDHVEPISTGGRHRPSNLQALCHRCNSTKGAATRDYRTLSQVEALRALDSVHCRP